MAGEIIQIVTTTADRADADTLALALLTRRLAGCVQIQGPIDSSYWWNGRLETAREWTCTIKSTRDRYYEIERVLLELHPYDEPEVVVMPAVEVSDGYARWLRDQVRPMPNPPSLDAISFVAESASSPTREAVPVTAIPIPAVLAESTPTESTPTEASVQPAVEPAIVLPGKRKAAAEKAPRPKPAKRAPAKRKSSSTGPAA